MSSLDRSSVNRRKRRLLAVLNYAHRCASIRYGRSLCVRRSRFAYSERSHPTSACLHSIRTSSASSKPNQ